MFQYWRVSRAERSRGRADRAVGAEALEKANIREKVKVVVGGAAITQEFADMIGADGYRPTAPEAIGLFKELIGQEV